MTRRREPPTPQIYFYHAQLVRAIKHNAVGEVNQLLYCFPQSPFGALTPVPEMYHGQLWGSAYSLAAHLGLIDIVRIFCFHNIPQHLQGFPINYISPLQAAVTMNHIDIVLTLLLNRGLNPLIWPWIDGPRLLMQAVAAERVEIASLLIDAGADVEDDSNLALGLPLQLAAFKGNVEIVKLLIARGANPYAMGCLGQTAQEIAVTEGHEDVIEFLEKVLLVDRRSASVCF
jgi:hypothetical protein